MVNWEVILYQCLFFMIFLSKWSTTYANDDTTIEGDEFGEMNGRIVNGTKVKSGNLTYIVSLRRAKSMESFCGGSVVTDRWILSAAHCMFLDLEPILPESVMIIGGDLKKRPASPHRQTSLGKEIIIHPKWSAKYQMNDIALISLETPFQINEYVKPIPLVTTMPPPNTMCTVAGWGFYQEGRRRNSNDLLFLEIPLLPTKVCKKLLSAKFASSKICAGIPHGGSGSCYGDSGGPLECDGVLTGIVSGGSKCTKPGPPGIYTRILSYMDWIKEVMGKHEVTVNNVSADSETTNKPINYNVSVHGHTFLCLCILLFISMNGHVLLS